MIGFLTASDFSLLSTLARALLRSETRFMLYCTDLLLTASDDLWLAIGALDEMHHRIKGANDYAEAFRMECLHLRHNPKPEALEAARALAWALELQRSYLEALR